MNNELYIVEFRRIPGKYQDLFFVFLGSAITKSRRYNMRRNEETLEMYCFGIKNLYQTIRQHFSKNESYILVNIYKSIESKKISLFDINLNINENEDSVLEYITLKNPNMFKE